MRCRPTQFYKDKASKCCITEGFAQPKAFLPSLHNIIWTPQTIRGVKALPLHHHQDEEGRERLS
eukprot:11701468-Ditylum_brightwellii.AAC.1